jgi:uncharacterized GH25 family protein
MNSKTPILLATLACGLVTPSVFAHDTWLIPARFQVAPGESATLDLTSGMAFPALDVGPKRERIQAVVCRLAGRTFDLNDFEAAPNSLRIKGVLPASGVAAFWVKSPPKEIELKPDQVQEYLDEIDAPATVRQQWADTKEPKRWRESYSKHSKTFIRVGDAKTDTSWREPVGMFLEIVPEKDPTALRAGDDLPVRVLKDGKPHADFSLGIIGAGDPKGTIQKTDAAGRVTFRLDKSDRWLLRGTDLRKSAKEGVDWESDFTTLTVEVAKR